MSQLETQIKNLDAEFDKLNEHMAQGETKSFGQQSEAQIFFLCLFDPSKFGPSNLDFLRWWTEADAKMKATTFVPEAQKHRVPILFYFLYFPICLRTSRAAALEMKIRLGTC